MSAYLRLRLTLLSPLCLPHEAGDRVAHALAHGLGLLPTALRGALATVLMQARGQCGAEGRRLPPALPDHRDWRFEPLMPVMQPPPLEPQHRLRQPPGPDMPDLPAIPEGMALARREARNFAWAWNRHEPMARPLSEVLCLPAPLQLDTTMAWKVPGLQGSEATRQRLRDAAAALAWAANECHGPAWAQMQDRLARRARWPASAQPAGFGDWLDRAQAQLDALDAATHQRAGTGWLLRLGTLAGATACSVSWPGAERKVRSRTAPQGKAYELRREPKNFWALAVAGGEGGPVSTPVQYELPGWMFVTADVVDATAPMAPVLPPVQAARTAGTVPTANAAQMGTQAAQSTQAGSDAVAASEPRRSPGLPQGVARWSVQVP